MNANSNPKRSALKCQRSTEKLLSPVWLVVLALAPPVWADEPPSASTLEFKFTPGVWITRLQGESKLGPAPAAAEISLHENLLLNSTEPAAGGSLEMAMNDRWRFELSGFHFSTDGGGAFPIAATFGGLTFAPGDAFSASFELTSVAIEAGYWLWQPYCIGPTPDGRECAITLRAGPVVGVRYAQIDPSVTQIGVGSQSAGGEWIAPYAGAQLQLQHQLPDSFPILDGLEINAGFGLGPALGGDGGAMFQLHAGVAVFFTPNLGAGMEYRLLELDVEDGPFELDGGLQGLFFFASLRF